MLVRTEQLIYISFLLHWSGSDPHMTQRSLFPSLWLFLEYQPEPGLSTVSLLILSAFLIQQRIRERHEVTRQAHVHSSYAHWYKSGPRHLGTTKTTNNSAVWHYSHYSYWWKVCSDQQTKIFKATAQMFWSKYTLPVKRLDKPYQ